jgi:hypothetical protein
MNDTKPRKPSMFAEAERRLRIIRDEIWQADILGRQDAVDRLIGEYGALQHYADRIGALLAERWGPTVPDIQRDADGPRRPNWGKALADMLEEGRHHAEHD